MTEPEQWAFWSVMNYDVVRKLAENAKRHNEQMKGVHDKLDLILWRTTAIEMNLQSQPSSLQRALQLDAIEMPTASFTASTVCWLHRVLTEVSRYRKRFAAAFAQCKYGLVRRIRREKWLATCRLHLRMFQSLSMSGSVGGTSGIGNFAGKAKGKIINGLAELHHRFLTIHPFMDANGRIARSITDQAARELLNQTIGPEFVEDPGAYYSALSEADKGRLTPLENRISAALK